MKSLLCRDSEVFRAGDEMLVSGATFSYSYVTGLISGSGFLNARQWFIIKLET